MKLRVGGAIAAALVVAVAITGGTAAAKASKCGTVTRTSRHGPARPQTPMS